MQAHGFGSSGEGREEFVAHLMVALIEGVFGGIVGRKGDALGWITLHKLTRCLARVVRRIEADVEKEWMVTLGSEADLLGGGLGPNGGGVADLIAVVWIRFEGVPPICGQPLTFARRVPGGPRIAGRGAMVGVGTGFKHAGGNGSAFFETALQGGITQVPLAGDERVVAGIGKCSAPERSVFEFTLRAERGDARIQHGATGDADGG